ncbi:MAG: hypothetical protein U0941_01545 [Planctomycetaceae bacterium]
MNKLKNEEIDLVSGGESVSEKDSLVQAISQLVEAIDDRSSSPLKKPIEEMDIAVCRKARSALTAFVDYRAWSGDSASEIEAFAEKLLNQLQDGARLLGESTKYGKSVQEKHTFLVTLLNGASFETLVEVANSGG